MSLTKALRPSSSRPQQPLTAAGEAARVRREAFKPVALPALAAAVQAQNAKPMPPKRPVRKHELPAILRDEIAFS